MDPNNTKSHLVPVQHEAVPWPQASDWSLVLTARNIPNWLVRADSGYMVMVPSILEKEAKREVRLYIQENHADSPDLSAPFKPRYIKQSLWTISMASASMAIFFRPEIRQKALDAGAADAGKIVSGEWWRCFTALMLHADPAHFLGNVMIGGLIVAWLIEESSPSTAWFLTIMAGFMGNLLNAVLHDQNHISIGASTAVFGALGSLIAIRAIRMRKEGLSAIGRPLGAGAALLAMLGTGGGNTDLTAHLFGFTSGLFLGLTLYRFLVSHIAKYRGLEYLFGLTTPLMMLLSWGLALVP